MILTPIDLTEFRASWGNGEVTTHRKHERMVSFFSFCVRNELLRKNAMEALKKPKTPDIVPTDYFLAEEFEAIVKATEKYDFGGGTDCHDRAGRLRDLTLLMRWSGLSILDATKIERDRLSSNENGDDQIFLYRAKTGVPVLRRDPVRGRPSVARAPQFQSALFFLVVGQWRSTQRRQGLPALVLEGVSTDQRSKGNRPKPVPQTIVISLRLAIPRRVVLQQSPPPLRQPRTIVAENKLFE